MSECTSREPEQASSRDENEVSHAEPERIAATFVQRAVRERWCVCGDGGVCFCPVYMRQNGLMSLPKSFVRGVGSLGVKVSEFGPGAIHRAPQAQIGGGASW